MPGPARSASFAVAMKPIVVRPRPPSIRAGADRATGKPSALLEDGVPDALGDLAQVVARAGEPAVELPLGRDLAQVVHGDQRRHRLPVDLLDAALALRGPARGLGRLVELAAAERRDRHGELPDTLGELG